MLRLQKRNQAGFTLIELLIVVAIIIVLMAILLPALSGARASAKRVVCMNQLSEIGRAVIMYTEDYNGRLMLRANAIDNLPQVLAGKYTNGTPPLNQMSYINTCKVFFCTETPDTRATRANNYCYAFFHPASGTWADVSVNEFVTGRVNNGWDGGTLVYRNLPNPSGFILGACSRRLSEKVGYWAYIPGSGLMNNKDGIALLHLGLTNTLMGDGHVESQTFQQMRSGYCKITKVIGTQGEVMLLP